MNSNMIKTMTKLEYTRAAPLAIVTAIIGLGATIMLYINLSELQIMGYLIIRHLPVVFALILGADMAARDQEQKTQTSMFALPISTRSIWLISSVNRIFMILILWILIKVFLALSSNTIQPILAKEIQGESDYLTIAIPVLIFYSFFASVFCSLFSRETLTSIGVSSAILVAGTLLSSTYAQKHMTLSLISLTTIFAIASLIIFSSRKQWKIKTQWPVLLTILCFSSLIIWLLP